MWHVLESCDCLFLFIALFSLGEVVALKKLKMENEKEGFPITSLREINMLMKAKHPNIVHVRVSTQGWIAFLSLFLCVQEVVVGSNMDKIYIVMDYVEHDLKALMETMKQPFLEGVYRVGSQGFT